MSPVHRLFVCLALASSFLVTHTAVAGSSDDYYVNARFGYFIAYPGALFAAQPELTNGDGREFHGRHGAPNFVAWGAYNAADETPADMANEAETDNCARRPAAYRVVKPALVAISCETRTGAIFYRKTLIRGDTTAVFEITYPASEKAKWNPIVSKIAGSLALGEQPAE